MPKLRILKACQIKGEPAKVGQVVDVDVEDANTLTSFLLAEPAKALKFTKPKSTGEKQK